MEIIIDSVDYISDISWDSHFAEEIKLTPTNQNPDKKVPSMVRWMNWEDLMEKESYIIKTDPDLPAPLKKDIRSTANLYTQKVVTMKATY